LATVERVTLQFEFKDLLDGKVLTRAEASSLVLRGLQVFVLRSKEGRWNWVQADSGGSSGGGEELKIEALLAPFAGRLSLENSSVIFSDELKSFHSTLKKLDGR